MLLSQRRIPWPAPAFSTVFNPGLAPAPLVSVRGTDRLGKLAGRRPRQGLDIVPSMAADG
ncbi:MAG TPA: hypothetical protein PLN26_09610 [Acidobacteriota bacterium]|nr:hypothetical protein [Acidobacteriota bacterium]HQG93380.1 hypothetical protein [Acidobacteriota bacterium]HQK88264.1 hypothetical protein [Acidobacteriota bacterium]